jgi:hypothetical protein
MRERWEQKAYALRTVSAQREPLSLEVTQGKILPQSGAGSSRASKFKSALSVEAKQLPSLK